MVRWRARWLLWGILAAPPIALTAGAATAQRPVAEAWSVRWQPLPGDRPLGGHSALIDVPAATMILHGGEREGMQPPPSMRQLDLTAGSAGWSDYRPSGNGPVPRLEGRGLPGSAAIIDPNERMALTVCDCRNGSTFLLDLANRRWLRAPNDRSLPMWYPVLAYDPAGDRAILYGGDEQGDALVSSAGWVYDMSPARRGWRRLADAPFRLAYQASAVDDRTGHILAFGGQDDRGAAVADLWRLDMNRLGESNAWQQLSPQPGPAPEARYGASLTFVPGTGRAILIGGWSPEGDFGDVWLLDYEEPDSPAWQLLEARAAAGPRSGHSAVWDPTVGRIVVYGGVRGYDFLADAWALYLEAVPPTSSPQTVAPTETATPVPTSTEPPTQAPTQTPTRVAVYLPRLERD